MVKEKEKIAIKGTARVKKYNADQDETVEEPVEIVERNFELSPDLADHVRRGGKIEIVNGNPQKR